MNIGETLLLNEVEAALLLGMSSHRLRHESISSRSVGIPFIRIGGSIRYRRLDLELWINDQIKAQASNSQRAQLTPETRTDQPRRRGRSKTTSIIG